MIFLFFLLTVYLYAGEESALSTPTQTTSMLFVGLWIFKGWAHKLLELVSGPEPLLKELKQRLGKVFQFRFFQSNGFKEEYRNLLESRLGQPFQIVVIETNDPGRNGLATTKAVIERKEFRDGWRLAGAYYREGKVTCFLTKGPLEKGDLWSQLGIKFRAKCQEDLAKIGKRLSRMLSHHTNMVFGVATKVDGGTYLFKTGKSIYRVRVMEDPAFDGLSLCSSRLAREVVGHPVRLGFRFASTGLMPFGGIKDHVVVASEDELGDSDFLVYGAKKEIFCDPEDSFLGCLEESHGKKSVRIDIQQTLNFGFTAKLANGARIITHIANEWVSELLEEFRQPGFLQKQIEKLSSAEEPDSTLEANEVHTPNSQKRFREVLARLSRPELGFDIMQAPSLYKSLVNTLIGKVFDLQGLRVPSGRHAIGRYLTVDYSSLVAGVQVESLRLLREGECFIPGLVFPDGVTEMKVALTRQPSGGPMEHFVLYAVTSPELEKQFSGARDSIIVSRDQIREICDTLGGADQDDRLTVYISKEMVDVFERYVSVLDRDYPVIDAPPQEGLCGKPLPLELTPETAYGLAVRMFGMTSIGETVNVLMPFNYLWSIRGWLERQGTPFSSSTEIAWVARHLDWVVDGANKTGVQVTGLKKALELFTRTTTHVPSALLCRLGGTNFLRARLLAGNPVKVLHSSPLEGAIAEMHQLVEGVRAELKLSGEPKTPLDYVIGWRFRGYEAAMKVASQLHDTYKRCMKNRVSHYRELFLEALNEPLSESSWTLLTAALQRAAFRDAAKEAAESLSKYNDLQKAKVMAAYYALVYRVGKSGRQMTDALLWSDELQGHTTKAIELAYQESAAPGEQAQQ